jgi:hypothetical protein
VGGKPQTPPVQLPPREESIDLSRLKIEPGRGKIWFRSSSSSPVATSSTSKGSEACEACDAMEQNVASAEAIEVEMEARSICSATQEEDEECKVNKKQQQEQDEEQKDQQHGLGGVPLERQFTLAGPSTVITPSEDVARLAGALPPEALLEASAGFFNPYFNCRTFSGSCYCLPSAFLNAERCSLPLCFPFPPPQVYAGRHAPVPEADLVEAAHLLRYAYATYVLQPRMERTSWTCPWPLPWCWAAPDPAPSVLKAMGELRVEEERYGAELLHLNCSNKVLAHLPNLVALDHSRRSVIIAIRCEQGEGCCPSLYLSSHLVPG